VVKQKKRPIPAKVLIGFMIFGILVLIGANIVLFLKPTTISSITSSGSSTFSIFDGSFTFVIDNNADAPDKVTRIYGLDSNTPITISASALIEDTSGNHINPENVLFNNQPSYTVIGSSIEHPAIVTISIKNNQHETGLYHGSIFISGEKKTSIPITVDIKPTFDRVIIWVINGIAIAVAFWKIVKYFNERYAVDPNPPPNPNPPLGNQYKSLGFSDFLEAKKITWGTIGKNAILDLSSVIFGMVVGVFALFDNSYITGVHFLDPASITVLIGIGLGIGSLKEYIHGVSEPSNPPEEKMYITN
jgi:hypothetical protein